MNISFTSALILIILTSFMWGSWFQFSLRLKQFPIYGFMLLMYLFSVVIVWGAIAFLAPAFLSDSIIVLIGENWKSCLLIILCGMAWSVGMQVNLLVVTKVGLIMSTSITATANIILGTGISILFGGLREGQSVIRIFLGALVLLAATILGQYSAVLRDNDTGKTAKKTEYKNEIKERRKNMLLLLLAALFLQPCYNVALSAFVQTDLKPDGVPELLCVGMLAIGTLLGALLYSGVQLSKNGEWHLLFSDKKVLLMAAVSSVCHYGGNLIYTICTPVLSHAIAWPLGTSYNFWSYIWGIAYGEYNKTSKKTKLVLAMTIMGFVAGILILC